mmetsp:Transcript_59315/g.68682  ORF Transcript_59315/g.68682 Transcript_59315/m.68682 type:complete len:200 (+) Transcript_59315:513-1112(+)
MCTHSVMSHQHAGAAGPLLLSSLTTRVMTRLVPHEPIKLNLIDGTLPLLTHMPNCIQSWNSAILNHGNSDKNRCPSQTRNTMHRNRCWRLFSTLRVQQLQPAIDDVLRRWRTVIKRPTMDMNTATLHHVAVVRWTAHAHKVADLVALEFLHVCGEGAGRRSVQNVKPVQELIRVCTTAFYHRTVDFHHACLCHDGIYFG